MGNKGLAAMFDFDALETAMPSEPVSTVVASGVAEQTKEEAERQAKVDGRNKTTGEPKPDFEPSACVLAGRRAPAPHCDKLTLIVQSTRDVLANSAVAFLTCFPRLPPRLLIARF